MGVVGYVNGSEQTFDGQSGSGGTTGNPSVQAADLSKIPATGGLAGIEGLLLVPMKDDISGFVFFYELDPEDFNTESDVVYEFRQEEIQEGRLPTIHRVRVMYRDLGKVTVVVGVRGFLNGNSEEKVVALGSEAASGKVLTTLVDLQITDERPQLYFRRLKDAGPLAIIKMTLCGSLGDGEQM